MPWALEIHQIDVGQGESTLIVARENDNNALLQARSMLIDGGHGDRAAIVHQYLQANIPVINGVQQLNTIVVTHFDIDHSNGIRDLLYADNCHAIASAITEAAGTAAAAAAGHSQLLQQMAATAAAYAVASGLNDAEAQDIADNVIRRTFKQPMSTVDQAIGFAQGEIDEIQGTLVALLPKKGLVRRRRCEAIGATAGSTQGTAAARTAAALNEFLPILRGIAGARPIDTNGLYTDCTIIDPGNLTTTDRISYQLAVEGAITISSVSYTATSIGRQRENDILGKEIFWQPSNRPRYVASDPVPLIFVLAENRDVLGAPNPFTVTGHIENDISIGLVVRFGDFTFYTGGDLPALGEDRVVKRLFQVSITLGNNSIPAPLHVCGFKCGHHGAETSTSHVFVSETFAATAVVSCGYNNAHDHPRQVIIDRLQSCEYIQRMFFTNVGMARYYVPLSPGYSNLPPLNVTNPALMIPKGVVAGDNNPDNLAIGRFRGNIAIHVNAEEANCTRHLARGDFARPGILYHQFRVVYWDMTRVGGPGFCVEMFPH